MSVKSKRKKQFLPASIRNMLEDRAFQRNAFILSVLVPMGIVFVLFWIYPLLDGFYGSLTDWRAFQPEREFIGLEHYATLLQDDNFHDAVLNTFEFVLLYLPAMIALALLLALAIESVSSRWKPLFRTVYFMPVVTSVIATALIWSWLYQPRFGLFNSLLSQLGLGTLGFLRDPGQALPSIAVYALWKNLGFNIVLFMAGLSSIDRTYYEAASVDGANGWQTFWHITLPLLRPTFVFVLITGMINTLQIFGPVYVMTAQTGNDLPGGPLNSTLTLAVYQWQTAFRELNLGYGAALGIMLFLIVLVITLIQARFLRFDVND